MSTSRLRLIYKRQRRTFGVVRFNASPAYKLRRCSFGGERVHERSMRLQTVTRSDLELGGHTYTRGVEINSAFGERLTDWSAA